MRPWDPFLDFNANFLTSTLNKATSENKVVFLLGDFNVDLLAADTEENVSDYFYLLTSYSFLPHIIFPTRVTVSTSKVIDNIFLNSTNWNTTSGNLISSISDHFPQFLILNNPNQRKSLSGTGVTLIKIVLLIKSHLIIGMIHFS